MKQFWLCSTFLVGFLFLVSCPIQARETVKDNSLTFSEDRIAQDENETLGDTSDMTSSLFQEGNEELFGNHRKKQAKQETMVTASLFSKGTVKSQSRISEDLFLGAAVNEKVPQKYATHQVQETDSQVGLSVDETWVLLTYCALNATVVLVAAIATYRVKKKEEHGFTYKHHPNFWKSEKGSTYS